MNRHLLKNIKTYWEVYLRFIANSASSAMSFRLNFFLFILLDMGFLLVTLGTTDFLFNHVATIGAWDRYHMLFFITFVIFVDWAHMLFLSENFWELSILIRTGMVDFIILLPLSPLFTLFFRHVRIACIFNCIPVLTLLFYFGSKIGLTFWQWPLVFLLSFLSLLLMGLLEITTALMIFWVQEGMGINFLRIQMQNISRWPDFIYKSIWRRIFMIAFPLLLIGSGPMEVLFKHKYSAIIYLILSILIFSFIVSIILKRALLQYESSSS